MCVSLSGGGLPHTVVAVAASRHSLRQEVHQDKGRLVDKTERTNRMLLDDDDEGEEIGIAFK